MNLPVVAPPAPHQVSPPPPPVKQTGTTSPQKNKVAKSSYFYTIQVH